MATTRRPQRKNLKAITAARVTAQALGPLLPVQPAAVGFDGAPKLGPGQAYAMKTGTVFHPAWCIHVGIAFDQNPKRVIVILESQAGQRKCCPACSDPIG